MTEKLENKKQLKPQLTIEQEREQLKKDMEKWEKDKERILKEIDEHYEKNPGGGMYYRWFDDDCYHMEESFRERALKILKREEREQNAITKEKLQQDEEKRKQELLAESKKKEPKVVKARLQTDNETTRET